MLEWIVGIIAIVNKDLVRIAEVKECVVLENLVIQIQPTAVMARLEG